MVINKPHVCTKINIFQPKWSGKHSETKDWIVKLAEYKVRDASPIIIITFDYPTLKYGRYAITRAKAMSYPIGTNGKIPTYEIPFSALESWDSAAEVRELIDSWGW